MKKIMKIFSAHRHDIAGFAVLHIILVTLIGILTGQWRWGGLMEIMAPAIVILCGRMYQSRKFYFAALALMLIFPLSILGAAFIAPDGFGSLISHSNKYITFSTALSELLIYIVALSKNFLKNALSALILIFIAFIDIIIWGYYFSSGSLLNVDAIMALMQTNASEALEYTTTHISVTQTVILLIAIIIPGGVCSLRSGI